MDIRSSVKGRSIGEQREKSRVLRGDRKEMNREGTFNAHQSSQSNVRRLISLMRGRRWSTLPVAKVCVLAINPRRNVKK